MKIVLTVFAILLIALSVRPEQDRQLVQGNATASTRRLALVIGNAAYANAPPLKNPANDANDVADRLSELGFTVDRGVNLTQRSMKAKIREFGQKLKAGGHGLFYFAGHGVQLRGRNFLIPVDADIQSETDVEDQGVDTNLVLGMMDEAGNGLNVIILDACRNNPFARSFRSAANGLAQMDAPSGTLIAYATAPGSVASDGNNRNGLYTSELLKNMMVPGLSIEEVFKRVRISVRNSTAGKQTPWEASSLTGDFYFRKANETARVTPPVSPPVSRPNTAICFAEDPGAESIDRATHYEWGKGQSTETLENNFKYKANLLFQCKSINADAMSTTFANVSVVVARYVSDPKCFDGDGGVLSTVASDHKAWGAKQSPETMLGNLQWKFASALKCLDRPKQVSFFADASAALAGASQ